MRVAGPDFWDPVREDRHIQPYRGQRATQIELQTTGGRSEIKTNSVGIAGQPHVLRYAALPCSDSDKSQPYARPLALPCRQKPQL